MTALCVVWQCQSLLLPLPLPPPLFNGRKVFGTFKIPNSYFISLILMPNSDIGSRGAGMEMEKLRAQMAVAAQLDSACSGCNKNTSAIHETQWAVGRWETFSSHTHICHRDNTGSGE